jgi:Ca2+-dependent lipid-binding protein
LNEEKVFKSQPKKKTLTPVWNENFELMVVSWRNLAETSSVLTSLQQPSRVGGAFSLEAFDWNQLEQAKSLGSAKIELADLEPFQPTERSLPLVSAKHGEKGEIRIRILFHPQIIARTRKSTSTFSTAGRAMTQVGALPFGAGKGVIHGVGHAGTKAKGLFKFGGKGGKDDSDDDDGTIAAPAPAPDPPSAQVSEPSRGVVGGPAHPFPQTNTALLAEDTSPPAEYGKLKVTVVGAKDIGGGSGDSLKPYVTIKLGDKEFKTKHGAKTLTPEWYVSLVPIFRRNLSNPHRSKGTRHSNSTQAQIQRC